MSDLLLTVVNYIQQLPFLLKCFVLTTSVAIEYIFPIFPGDTIVLLAGFLQAHGALSLLESSISIVIGSVLGAMLGYRVGLWIVNKSHKHKWLAKWSSPEAFARFTMWFRKWGSIVLLFNRFVPGVRILFFVAAGTAKIPMPKVVLFGSISALVFNGCLLLLGVWLGYNSDRVLTYLYRYHVIFYLFLAFLLSIYLVYFWQKKRRQ